MELKLQDGQNVQVQEGINALDVAKEYLPDLYKQALAADLNGEWIDAFAPSHQGGTLKMLTWEDEGGKWTLRHTASHIMAQAVLRLFPGTKLAIGPAIENGFY